MKQEIDLMADYPRSKRDVGAREQNKTVVDRALASRFGKDFFDGKRSHGYGGFHYHPRFWQPVIPTFQQHFKLTPDSSVLDVGCAKGFMLFDMQNMIPGIKVEGIDISTYAIKTAKTEVQNNLQVADARSLPFEDNSFDFLVSINTLHNLERDELVVALEEIERVKRIDSFITVDAYRNDDEKARMEAWNLTAKTIMHVDEWKAFFKQVGYTGDYFWFIP
jgi:SAM-dependent methyltransferase